MNETIDKRDQPLSFRDATLRGSTIAAAAVGEVTGFVGAGLRERQRNSEYDKRVDEHGEKRDALEQRQSTLETIEEEVLELGEGDETGEALLILVRQELGITAVELAETESLIGPHPDSDGSQYIAEVVAGGLGGILTGALLYAAGYKVFHDVRRKIRSSKAAKAVVVSPNSPRPPKSDT